MEKDKYVLGDSKYAEMYRYKQWSGIEITKGDQGYFDGLVEVFTIPHGISLAVHGSDIIKISKGE